MADDEPAGEALLSVGRVGRPHGLDGSFHVTRPRPRLLAADGSLIVNGTTIAITRMAGTRDKPILRLEGVESREAVEALRGAELWVPRAAAPPLDEDEWYAEDLERCRVVDGKREVGTVRRLLPYPSCDLLEVKRTDPGRAGGDLLVPLVSDAVRSVDLEAGIVDVDLAFLGEDA